MKRKNLTIVSIIAITLLIVAAFGTTYAYLIAKVDSNDNEISNVNVNLPNRPNIYVSKGSNVKLDITFDKTKPQSSYPYYIEKINTSTPASVKINKYENGTIKFCYVVGIRNTGDVIDHVSGHPNDPQLQLYVKKNNNYKYIDITSFGDEKFIAPDLSLKFATNNFEGLKHQINSSSTSNVQDTWIYGLRYINYNYDQQIHAGKKLSIEVKFKLDDCDSAYSVNTK